MCCFSRGEGGGGGGEGAGERECEAREKRDLGEKKSVRVEANLAWSVCCRPTRLDHALHVGETGGKTGRGHGLTGRKPSTNRQTAGCGGKRRSEKHISVQAGRDGERDGGEEDHEGEGEGEQERERI